MTLIVGILCKDGVVMASDSAATFGADGRPTIGQQEIRKVHQVNDCILHGGTGAIGVGQLIQDTLKSLWDANKIRGTPDAAGNIIGSAINSLVRPYLETAQWQRTITGDASTSLCRSLVAIPVEKRPFLFQFDFNGVPERATAQLPIISVGSGQVIADPFLAFLKRVLWKDSEPSVSEGRLAAVWAIDHVCRTNPGGVGGHVQLATLTSHKPGELPKVQMSTEADIEEHLQRIASAEQVLVNELRGVKPADANQIPAPPKA